MVKTRGKSLHGFRKGEEYTDDITTAANEKLFESKKLETEAYFPVFVAGGVSNQWRTNEDSRSHGKHSASGTLSRDTETGVGAWMQ